MEGDKEKARKAMAEAKEKITQNIEGVDHKIIVMSGKGGVGKSTVAANIAAELTNQGFEVGLMDCDMHGPSIPKLVGISYENRPTGTSSSIKPISTSFGLKVMSLGSLLPEKDSPVVWRGPLKTRTIQQFLGDVDWPDLDYLVFDLPPGTGDEPLSVAQFIPEPDGAVIVSTPQEVALQTIRRSINFAKEVGLPVLGLIENMSGFVCPHCGNKVDIFRSGGCEDLSEELGVPFLGRIPLDPDIVESGEEGQPIVLKSDSDASEAFKNIVCKMQNIKESANSAQSEDQ